MNIKQLEQLERLRNEYLRTLDDSTDDTYFGTQMERERDALLGFLHFLEEKLDFESDEVSE